MNTQDYIDVMNDLNEQLESNKYFEDLGIYFSYSTTGFSDAILFGEHILYCSENDSLSKYSYEIDDYVDISLKDFLIEQFNIFKKELFKIELK